jgi:hypothetical protein
MGIYFTDKKERIPIIETYINIAMAFAHLGEEESGFEYIEDAIVLA